MLCKSGGCKIFDDMSGSRTKSVVFCVIVGKRERSIWLQKDAQQAGNVLVPWEICGRSSDREDRRAQRFRQHRRTRVGANKLAVELSRLSNGVGIAN